MPNASNQNIAVRFDEGVPLSAPCLDGHFQGNPIVPGAILLGYGADILRQQGFEITEIPRVKFLKPLAPETSFVIEIAMAGGGASLTWHSGEAQIARAKVVLRARSA